MSTSRLFRKTPIRSGSWLTRAPIRSAHVVAGMLALSILGAGLAPAQNILDGTDLAGVTFADGGVLNLEGDALLSISKNLPSGFLTINGLKPGGSTIRLNNGTTPPTLFGRFSDPTAATLNLSNVTITGGNQQGTSPGGAISATAATSDLTLKNTGSVVTFSGNLSATNAGAINSFFSMAIRGIRFIGNEASRNSSAVANNGNMTIIDSTFIGNKAGGRQNSGDSGTGGAIANAPPNDNMAGFKLTITDSSFIGNEAVVNPMPFPGSNTGAGGAIYNKNGGILTLNATSQDVSFSGNHADEFGGAIFTTDGGSLTLNATSRDISFTGNHADELGGAIYIDKALLLSPPTPLPPSLTLNATGGDITFSGNTQGAANQANAIGLNADSSPIVTFNAGAGHVITFLDPIASNSATGLGLVTVTKTGAGTVIFHGSSPVYAKTEVSAGAFELATGATYGLRAADVGGSAPSSFTVGPGATLLGGAGRQGAGR